MGTRQPQFRHEAPRLLEQAWHPDWREHPSAYTGEPGRTLVFCTRKDARAWCRERTAFYGAYPEGHVCRFWWFRPVRVVERVTVSPPAARPGDAGASGSSAEPRE
jgi:hypothetical protein